MSTFGTPPDQLDAMEGPLASTDLMRVTLEWRQKETAPTVEVEADLIGLQLAAPREGESVWGTRYGPWAIAQGTDGGEVHVPPKESITPDALDRWAKRARAARHPYLKFRFADLVWDLAPLVAAKKDVAYARMAVDAAMEGMQAGDFKFPIEGFKAGQRALELSRMINDSPRVVAVERALFAYEKTVGQDLRENTWGYALELIAENTSQLPQDERDVVVADMEARLARLADMNPHPHTVEAAALPLAHLYRRQNRHDDVGRVLRLYSKLVVDAGRRMQGMAAASFLDRVHAVLEEYGLRGDAEALGPEMQEQGRRSVSELKQISTTITIPAEEMAAAVDEVLSGTQEEALQKIAFWFVVERNRAEEQVRESIHSSPLMADMPKTIIDQNGRAITTIGSVEDDLEGNVVQHISRRIQAYAPYLRATLSAAKSRINLDTPLVMEEVRKSVAFGEDRHPLVEEGVRYYFADEHAAAVHVLVPQIEAAIRRLATVVGVMPYRRNEKTKHLENRSLGSLLEDGRLVAVLDERLAFYLRILLTDVRGWNLRNEVSHGLLKGEHFGPVMADRVLHTVLMLTRFRTKPSEPAGAPTSEPAA